MFKTGHVLAFALTVTVELNQGNLSSENFVRWTLMHCSLSTYVSVCNSGYELAIPGNRARAPLVTQESAFQPASH